MKTCTLLILQSFLLVFIAQAQSPKQDEALRLFNEEKYAAALPLFQKQVDQFPKDPRYQYYAGICMIQCLPSNEKALEYLKYAAERSVPREVYFYLGQWYHKAYKFDEAIAMYEKYMQVGDPKNQEKLQPKQQIELANNARKIVDKKTIIKVLKTDTINRIEVFKFYNKLLKNGKFIEKNEKANLFADQLTSWSFVPSLLDNEQPVFQIALRKNMNRDIVLTRKTTDNQWTKPESVSPLINTDLDEDYVYFNPNEPALYFASKGQNSMGGYDIYKSVYYPNSKTWITPVNLGFPINSTGDDFLFVPSDDESCAWFASNRGVSSDKLVVYTISYSKDYAITSNSSNKDNLGFSLLNAIVPMLPTAPAPNVATPKPVRTSNPIVAPEPAPTPSTPTPSASASETQKYPQQLLNNDNYNALLNEALRVQVHGDSLARAAEELRQKLAASTNDAEKEKLKKDISWYELRAKNTQTKADSLYAKVKSYEQALSKKQNAAAPIAQAKPDSTKASVSTQQKTVATDSKSTSAPQKAKPLYDFKVMAKSPYKTVNDIPRDIKIPNGVVYRIQMGAFSKPIEPDKFKGIIPVSGETLQNGVVKYYVGLFSRNEDAEKALNKIREYGFKDAYIVSYYNGSPIVLSRAKDIEKNAQ